MQKFVERTAMSHKIPQGFFTFGNFLDGLGVLATLFLIGIKFKNKVFLGTIIFACIYSIISSPQVVYYSTTIANTLPFKLV